MSDVFCFTYFLSGFLFRVRGRVGVRDGVGDGFRVRVRFRASVRARWGQGFIHHNPNLLELKLRPSGKTRKKQKIVIGLEILSQNFVIVLLIVVRFKFTSSTSNEIKKNRFEQAIWAIMATPVHTFIIRWRGIIACHIGNSRHKIIFFIERNA